jgi:hypothetical protein
MTQLDPSESDSSAEAPSGDPPDGSLLQKLHINAPALTAILTLAAAIATCGVTSTSVWDEFIERTLGDRPVVEIYSPPPGPAAHQVKLTGIARNIPKGKSLWFMTRAIDDGDVWHPSDKECLVLPDASFDCAYWIGGKNHDGDPRSYTIVAFFIDTGAKSEIAEYHTLIARQEIYPGMKRPPAGSGPEMDWVTVSRSAAAPSAQSVGNAPSELGSPRPSR